MNSSTLLLPIAACLIASFSCSHVGEKRVHVGYIVISEALCPEDRAILQWLEKHRLFAPQRIALTNGDADVRDVDVFWIHIPDSVAYAQWSEEAENPFLSALLRQNRARFLLTDYAALLPHEWGFESRKPEVKTVSIEDDWLFDEKGLQSWRGHPAFAGLFGGAFIWDSFEDHLLPRIGYFGDDFPQEGKVAAVEKSFIPVHRDSRLMIEYKSDTNMTLAIGAFVYFSRSNRLEHRLERCVENCLLYLAGKQMDVPVTYWKRYGYCPKEVTVSSEPVRPSPRRRLADVPETGLVIEDEDPGDDYVEVAGRRALVMGKERGGIHEMWVHPFRVVRDYEAGLVGKDSVAWLSDMDCRIEIRPESVTRTYTTPLGEVSETIFASLDRAGAIVHYETDRTQDVGLFIRFRSDLRWMWPYDEYALGDICFGYDDALKALHITDETGEFACLFGGDSRPERHLEGALSTVAFEGGQLRGEKTGKNQVYHGTLFSLKKDNDYCLNYALVGTNRGKDEALSDYAALIAKPSEEYSRIVRHYRKILNSCVIIESPDDEFNRLWKWGLVATDRFVVHTPPLGTALVAGFGTTARGWDGGHENSGRPGYGWYFGRDAAWSCFAIDDYGDCETVRSQLEFFQQFQDASGKIFHELSTSGVVHYDAADATPLYVILAAHYLRASGDLTFIEKSWLHLKKAMDFLYSTDTDSDLLIENTNVGHGWVEGGKLWGAHTTFYLAGLWAKTLKDAAYMTSHLNEPELSERYGRDAQRVRQMLNTDFWNESEQFFYYGKLADGSCNPERTILPAVVMYFNPLDEEKVHAVLRQYAGNGFTSDWGVRILSSESPLFNPRGYHYGSVWPLFTGWAALAEYEYGRSVQGFTHIFSNLLIKNHWASGYIEEVMHGAEYRPSGVCPHQCWSETNVLHPAITGMIGWKPHALENRVEVKPRFPLHWDQITVGNLRVGATRVTLRLHRSVNETRYIFSLQKGKSINVMFFPEIPEGMIVDEVTVAGPSEDPSPETHQGLPEEPILFALQEETTVSLRHRRGVGMIPLRPRRQPNDISEGYRIVDARLEGRTYIVDVEGRSGTEGEFALRILDQDIMSVEGGRVEGKSADGIATLSVRFPESEGQFVSKRIQVVLK